MENNKGKSEDSLKRMDKKAFWLGISAVVGILGLPYLVTQCSFGYFLGVKNANEIGDTLGGILGPFIGLMSAFLVYLALREQIKANNIIQKQFIIEAENKSEDFVLNEALKMLSDIEKRLAEIELGEKDKDGTIDKDISRICEIIIGSKMFFLNNKTSKKALNLQINYICTLLQLVLGNISDIYKLSFFYIRYESFLEKWFPATWESYSKSTSSDIFDYKECKDIAFFGNYISIHQFRKTLYEKIISLDKPVFQNINTISNPDWCILEKLQKEYLDLAV